MRATVRRRRSFALVAISVVVLALGFGFGHRGAHAARSLILPGAGLYDRSHWVVGAAFTVLAIASMVAWLQWGMDWLAFVVVVAGMGVSALLADPARATSVAVLLRTSASAHEFPLVVVVMGGYSAVRLAWRRTWLGRRRARRVGTRLRSVDACRCAALEAIGRSVAATPSVGQRSTPVPLDVDAVTRRCRRIGIAARGRVSGDPLRADHAHARAALALSGQLSEGQRDRLRADADGSLFGVPASEPGWVRLLDATLAAFALRESGHHDAEARWADALQDSFALRRGHRPSALWTPCAVRGPRSMPWEHSAALALCHAAGWIDGRDDWTALRTRTFASAARGNAVAEDERLVAAGRIWLCFVADDQAERIVGRVTIARDPIAVALRDLALGLRSEPLAMAGAAVPPGRETAVRATLLDGPLAPPWRPR